MPDRAALVTGASSGIGLAIAHLLGEEGHGLTVAARRPDKLETAARELRNAGFEVQSVAGNMADEDDVARIVATHRDRYGRLDVLVNCAGWFPSSPFREIDAAQWREVIEVNLTGGFLVIQALLPLLEGRGWGRIVNFGSASFFAGAPGQAHYVAAKGGVIGLSRSLANALGPEGITVNVVTPGLILSDAVRDSFPAAFVADQREQRALRRDLLPADLVGPVFFLASPDADLITGQVLNVDGGKFMP
jgi:NAD(P)-dependent dehydrogenase (short-subunit alcohol dehydrogenase family)